MVQPRSTFVSSLGTKMKKKYACDRPTKAILPYYVAAFERRRTR